MDTTIRNLDEDAYRALKAKAALTGKSIGELVNEAIRSYLARPDLQRKRGSLNDLQPEAYPKGNERLSEQINEILYRRKDRAGDCFGYQFTGGLSPLAR